MFNTGAFSTLIVSIKHYACNHEVNFSLRHYSNTPYTSGVPFAQLYYKYTTGEWIDLGTTEGQLQAAGFSFGYGGFATVILQYRVTLFAIPLIPIMVIKAFIFLYIISIDMNIIQHIITNL